MIYVMQNRQTVRVRTSNDPILVVVADHDGEGAKLNVEGTDHILFIMPRKARTHGPVDAYFLPSDVVATSSREAHREWLANQPNTKGDNRTWNLRFLEKPSRKNSASYGFARKWAAYRLPGEASTLAEPITPPEAPPEPTSGLKLGDVIAAAKRQIAEVAGVPPDAVRISVDLA
jgi:hypothetical protein